MRCILLPHDAIFSDFQKNVTDQQTDGWTQPVRDARTHLKMCGFLSHFFSLSVSLSHSLSFSLSYSFPLAHISFKFCNNKNNSYLKTLYTPSYNPLSGHSIICINIWLVKSPCPLSPHKRGAILEL